MQTLDRFAIVFFGEVATTVSFKVDKYEFAEDLVIACAKEKSIGHVHSHLFGLFHEPSATWLCSNQILAEWPESRTIQFRLRFKPGSVKLIKEDCNCFDYYFYQIRYDFQRGEYSKDLKSKVNGLIITDALRFMLEHNINRANAFDNDVNWGNFMPYKDRERKMRIMVVKGKEMKENLETAYNNSLKDPYFVKQQYIETIAGEKRSEVLPNYHNEVYKAVLDNHSRYEKMPVIVEFQPFNGNILAVRHIHDTKQSWTKICSIEELCFISVQLSARTVEISRKNGIPQYLTFDDVLSLKSFVSLLDGYYRLTEKWSFSICKEISSPELARLRSIKCHGPIGDDFAHKKLVEKAGKRPGVYLIRESSLDYDELYIDVLINENLPPKKFAVMITEEKKYHLLETDEEYSTLSDAASHLCVNSGPETYKLTTCLPPSEFDQADNLLLCRPSTVLNEHSDTSNEMNWPLVIPHQCLKFDSGKAFRSSSCFSVRIATLRNKKVVVKEVIEENNNSLFLRSMSKWMHAKSECVVNFMGLTLYAPLALVMEYLEYGPLDEFLIQHQSKLKVVDLIESVTYFARALWFLEENGLIHNVIRCHNLIVSDYTQTSLKVKLSDPLGDSGKDSAWIAPEVIARGLGAASSASDVWAFGTTVWEIFSYGKKPLDTHDVRDFAQPLACPPEMWNLVGECWAEHQESRKQPQSIVRDVRNIFYEVYNSRRVNCYSTPYEGTMNAGKAEDKHFLRSFLNRHSMSTLSLARSSITSTTTIFTGIGSSRSDLVSLCSEGQGEGALATPTESESWLIEANQLTLGKVLGQGCYGEVIKAQLTQWAGLKEEVVAVKRINQNVPSELGLLDMRREINIMKTLIHKNIVEIKGFVEDPQMMLVMEYVELGSLLTYLRVNKSRGFAEPESISLMKFATDIAEGMDYLVSKNIVHRDLAARNILVASPNHVKISDFGLAQFTDPSSNCYKMRTQRGLPLRWYAPESLKTFCFSHKSDIWSFGVTLWEMMSYGKDPAYPGDVKDERLLEVLERGVRLECPERCPLEVYHVMLSCWKEDVARPTFKELKQRFEDMQKA